jgi:hypothetical protein
MTTHDGRPMLGGHRRIRVLGLLLGVAAVAAMAVFAFAHPQGWPAGPGSPMAGSGDAPTNTMFTQPVVGPMKLGSTVTATTTPAGR